MSNDSGSGQVVEGLGDHNKDLDVTLILQVRD